jgi:hypothetical protein
MSSAALANYRPPLPAEVNNTLAAFWLAILFGIASTVVFIPLFGSEVTKLEEAKRLEEVSRLVQAENMQQTLWILAGGLAGVILFLAVFIAIGVVCRSKIALLLFKMSLILGMLIGGAGIAGAAWMIYDKKLSLGAVPMLSAALLGTIAIMPILFGFISFSLVHLRGVREFFNPPPEEEPARRGAVAAEEGYYEEEAYAARRRPAEAGEEVYGEEPAYEQAAFEESYIEEEPAAAADEDVVRAEFDEDEIVVAEFDDETPADVVRAEFDSTRMQVPSGGEPKAKPRLDTKAERAAHIEGLEPDSGSPSSRSRPHSDTGRKLAERQLEQILSDEESVNQPPPQREVAPEPESQEVELSDLHKALTSSKEDIDIGVEGLEPTIHDVLPADEPSNPSGIVDIEGLLEAAKGGSQSGLSGVHYPEVAEAAEALEDAEESPAAQAPPSGKKPAAAPKPPPDEVEDVLADVLGSKPDIRLPEGDIADVLEADSPKPSQSPKKPSTPPEDFLFEEEFKKRPKKK